MNTTATNTTEKMLQLIRAYRHMERGSYTQSENIIKVMCEVCDKQYLTSHIAGSWRYKKKNFAEWFLNLDPNYKYYLLCLFKVLDYGECKEKEYITKLEADPRAVMFLLPPGLLDVSRKLLLFFNNNGIEEEAIQGITLPKVPKNAQKQYGNSANWGDYILSLPASDQDTIIQHIINRK